MAKSHSNASTPASTNGQEANGIKREASADADVILAPDPGATSAIKEEDSISAHSSPTASASRIKNDRPSSPTLKVKPSPDETDVKPKFQANGNTSPAKPEMGKKSSRATAKAPPRVAPLFNDLPNATAEAISTFQVIDSSTYQNKYLGFTEAALECDCSEEWGG
jgi:[histone H3]-lysine36 N-trimethyltransferase